MKYARDVMTPYPLCLKANNTIDESIEVMLRNSYRGIPVVDENQAALGFVTESSLLKALAIQKQEPKKDKLIDHKQVLQEAILVTPDTKVTDFLADVVSRGNVRVLVKAEKNKVIGIISPRDLLKLFSGKLLETLAEEKQRKLDLENVSKNQKKKDFYENLNTKDLFYAIFYKHPDMHILFNSRGDILGMNQAFNINFNFQDRDLNELKLEHLFEQESYLSLLKEMSLGKNESKRNDIVLAVLKNAKNLIPVKCNLYTYKENNEYVHLLKVKIKED